MKKPESRPHKNVDPHEDRCNNVPAHQTPGVVSYEFYFVWVCHSKHKNQMARRPDSDGRFVTTMIAEHAFISLWCVCVCVETAVPACLSIAILNRSLGMQKVS